jgi:RHS repeat-associated protein
MVLVEERSSTNVLWPLTDNQGTVRDITNNAGAIQNHITYNSFVRIINQTNANVYTRFNYTGREFDGEAGLYYYRSRYYDPVVGRFISEDAIGFNAGDANLYRYVGNSAVNAIDPFGYRTINGKTPVCQAPRVRRNPLLSKNPACTDKDVEVPLTKDRLKVIGATGGLPGGSGNPDRLLGLQFENAILRSLNLPGNTRSIPVKTRNQNREAIVPDAIIPIVGIEPKTLEVDLFPESHFYESKTTGKDRIKNPITGQVTYRKHSISLGFDDFQAEGYLDAARQSPAALNGWIPIITFVTLDDVIVGGSLINEAVRRGVQVYQNIVYESCLIPGYIQTSPSVPKTSILNPKASDVRVISF